MQIVFFENSEIKFLVFDTLAVFWNTSNIYDTYMELIVGADLREGSRGAGSPLSLTILEIF